MRGEGGEDGKIVFLYKIVTGAVDRSYGIEVARLAGLPKEIIAKAKTILSDLEEGILDPAISATAKKQQRDENQIDMFNSIVPRPHRAIEELKKIDVNEITPLEALKRLTNGRKSYKIPSYFNNYNKNMSDTPKESQRLSMGQNPAEKIQVRVVAVNKSTDRRFYEDAEAREIGLMYTPQTMEVKKNASQK